jgi:hypothetical protein
LAPTLALFSHGSEAADAAIEPQIAAARSSARDSLPLMAHFKSHAPRLPLVAHLAMLRACLCQVRPSATGAHAILAFVVDVALPLLWRATHCAHASIALRLYALHTLDFAVRAVHACCTQCRQQSVVRAVHSRSAGIRLAGGSSRGGAEAALRQR